MKLSFIEVSGFRGFRDRVRFEIPSGFAVFAGRNGVGKSTVCDSIEYALTGELARYRIEKATTNAMSEYVWWRGRGLADAYYVTIGFIDEGGDPFVITRSREKGLVGVSERLIEERMCREGDSPEGALEQLCRTSIVRDELIARMSLELSDTERFAFVSAAIGSVNAEQYLERAKNLLRIAKAEEAGARQDYDRQRDRVAGLLENVTRSRDAASRSTDVSRAVAVLKETLNIAVDGLVDVPAAREAVAELQVRARGLQVLVAEAHAIRSSVASIMTDEYNARLSDAAAARSNSAKRVADSETAVEYAEQQARRERDISEIATALASLIRAGRTVGLMDGHCPLCDSKLSEADFIAGLARSEGRLSDTSTSVVQAEYRLLAAREELIGAKAGLVEAEDQLALLIQRRDAVQSQWDSFLVKAEAAGVRLSDLAELDVLESEIDLLSERLAAAERALRVLQVSEIAGGVVEAEARLATSRIHAENSDRRLARALRSLNSAREIDFALRRTAHEIVEDRLSSISPLLGELYQRLRPHIDWRQIEYRLRGDVRRFLSLSVGKDLNPQYLFSSGQRRAAGLAFLLSVYLSRSWTTWRTLVLDDPVQHIDDYRALNLVEILAALRREDRQIICAVEDDSLADLLVHRLRSSFQSPGIRYEFDTGEDGLPRVNSSGLIKPLATDVLSTPVVAEGRSDVG